MPTMKKGCCIAAGVVSVLAMGVAVLLVVGYFGISKREPTAEEKGLVITLEDLAAYGIAHSGTEETLTFKTKSNLDLTRSVEYDYDSTLDPDHDPENVLVIMSSAEIAPTEKSARETFAIMGPSLEAGVAIGGAKTEPFEGLDDLGDRAYAKFLVTKEGLPAGNIIMVRDRKIVLIFMITGVYFEDAGNIRDLFAPKLENSAKMQDRAR